MLFSPSSQWALLAAAMFLLTASHADSLRKAALTFSRGERADPQGNRIGHDGVFR
jgi:hypothetical protein